MAPPGDTVTAVNGDAMDLDEDEFDLGIEIPMPKDETLSIFDRFPEVFAVPQERGARTPSGMLSTQASVCFQLPKAPALHPDLLPYSYMIENPGQVPQALVDLEKNPEVEAWIAKICKPQSVAPLPNTRLHAYNIDGEKAIEVQIKRAAPHPSSYLIVVRGFKLLMKFRNMTIKGKAMYVFAHHINPKMFLPFDYVFLADQVRIHDRLDGRTIGLLIGRLFNGDRATLEVFNKQFLPENLEVVPVQTRGEIQKHFEALGARLKRDPHTRPREMVQLLKILRYLADQALQDEQHREFVGRLMIKKPYKGLDNKTVEVPAGGKMVPPGAELPRCLRLSPHFMGYTGPKWPFNVNPKNVDVCGMLKDVVAENPEPDTICPRQLYKVLPEVLPSVE
ncbi:hypothetical protein VPNG_02591 [Cytospora leucostoma]|uniref:Uncharacterized protein n=1 Tax=Cytospora leucostoma TaxID=1230097 RepID=A0A423XHM3_9PEZI|nr:hypothetical protein VPNG_02591 [Cytospora leucostoma]